MKQEFKKMTWCVKNHDHNRDVIKDYDVLAYRENDIKKMKKKCATKEEFAELLKREFMWRFWSRCEYEVIIEITEDDRVLLKPWIGCKKPEEVQIDVTDDESFDWKGFAELHISGQVYKNKAKIDVWDQVHYRWNDFVDYCWNFRHKWQRKKVEGVYNDQKAT